MEATGNRGNCEVKDELGVVRYSSDFFEGEQNERLKLIKRRLRRMERLMEGEPDFHEQISPRQEKPHNTKEITVEIEEDREALESEIDELSKEEIRQRVKQRPDFQEVQQ